MVEEVVWEVGAKEQETFWGSVPQDKPTVPVYPPVGVIVMVKLPEAPLCKVRGVGAIVALTPTATTVSVTDDDVLAAKSELLA